MKEDIIAANLSSLRAQIFRHCRKEFLKNCNVITLKHQRYHKSLMMTN